MYMTTKYNLQFEEYILYLLEYLIYNLSNSCYPKLIYLKGVTK